MAAVEALRLVDREIRCSKFFVGSGMQYVGAQQVKYILKTGAIHRQSQEIRTPRESQRMKDYRALVVERC